MDDPEFVCWLCVVLYNLASEIHVIVCFRCNILGRVPNSALWILRFPAAGEMRLRACKLLLKEILLGPLSSYFSCWSPLTFTSPSHHLSFDQLRNWICGLDWVCLCPWRKWRLGLPDYSVLQLALGKRWLSTGRLFLKNFFWPCTKV